MCLFMWILHICWLFNELKRVLECIDSCDDDDVVMCLYFWSIPRVAFWSDNLFLFFFFHLPNIRDHQSSFIATKQIKGHQWTKY